VQEEDRHKAVLPRPNSPFPTSAGRPQSVEKSMAEQAMADVMHWKDQSEILRQWT
jgi:hypothetical protein